MKKKIFSGFLSKMAIVIPVFFAVIFSSCYYDYGLDSDTNYDVVFTFYNPDFNFSTIQNYYLYPTVKGVGGGTVTGTYADQIISETQQNLNELGWTQITDSNAAINTPNTMYIVTGEVTTTTTEVSCGYDWWGYYGGWYYPDYYCGYSYTYTTGTIAILMANGDDLNGGTVPVQWSGVLNGLTNSSGGSTGGTVQQRITKGINQAFEQSPYLK